MKANQRLVVVVSPDNKGYVYWVEDRIDARIPDNAVAKTSRTTSASALATALQAELPTLST